jgi:hypothetical protein
MSKMGLHDPFGHLKHKLWPKEGSKVNWLFDSRPLKVGNRPNFFAFKWCATYCWKALDKAYNFALAFISIGGFQAKLWAPKLQESQLWEWLPRQNDIWVLVPWPGIKYTIRGKVVASPEFGPWWVLWVRGCPHLVRALKCYNYALTNLLFDLCRHVWVIEVLVNLPCPISKLQHAPLPLKCCELRSAPQLFLLSMSSPLDSQLSPSRNLRMRHSGPTGTTQEPC